MNFPFYESAPKKTLDACPLCGDKDLLLNGRFDRYGLEAQSLRCWCGLVFLSPRMTVDAYREFYRDGHYRRLLSEFYGKPMTPAIILDSQKDYANRLAIWLGDRAKRINGGIGLDLGGATGVVAKELGPELNLDMTIVEPSMEEAQTARGWGLPVVECSIEDFDPHGMHYDLITLCQTVDHLLDIGADLARIRNWLAPDGLFFVDFVENAPVKIDHPFLLSRDTMRAYLEKAGFRLRAMEPAGDGLHVNVLAEGA